MPENKKIGFLKWLFIVPFGFMILLCGGINLLIRNAPKASPEEREALERSLDAIKYKRYLEEMIRPKLKTPTVAEFKLEAKPIGKWAVLVDGTVTSRNSFNAPITSKVSGVWGRENDGDDLDLWGYVFEDLDTTGPNAK